LPSFRLLQRAGLLATCLLTFACQHEPDHEPTARTVPTPPPPGEVHVPKASLAFLQIATVASEPEVVKLRVPGRVAFRDGAMSRLGTPVPARVAAVHVVVGAVVHAGDPLVTLSSPQAAETRAQVEHARLQIRLGQEMVRRQKDMLAHGVGIDSERFQAEMQLAQAQADLRKYENQAALLGEGKNDVMTLRAPIDGAVIVRRASVGATVDPSGEPLIEIGNPSSLWVVADVFEQDLALVRVGAEATVDLAAAATPLQGNVASVAGRVEAGQRRVPVYVALDMPIGGRCIPGSGSPDRPCL
jgi:cobalt-zinc-cadmium efflux system membrane fusion protein